MYVNGKDISYAFAGHSQVLSQVREQMDRKNTMYKQSGLTNIMHNKRAFKGSYFSNNRSTIKESPANRETVARRPAAITKIKAADIEKIKKSPAARQAEREALVQELAREKALYQEKKALRLHMKTQKMSCLSPGNKTFTNSKIFHTISTQTEEDMYAKSVHEMSTGTDASTPVDETELFDFDTEVTPIVETMVADVLHQAINEMLYKEKLAARIQHQKSLYFECTTAEIEMFGLERNDETMRTIISEHTQLFEKGEENEKARLSKLPPSYGTDFLPRILQDQNEIGAQEESLEFVQWLMNELQVEKTKNIKIEDLLNDK